MLTTKGDRPPISFVFNLIVNFVGFRLDESTRFTTKPATKGTDPASGIFDWRLTISGIRYPASAFALRAMEVWDLGARDWELGIKPLITKTPEHFTSEFVL